MPSLIVVAPGSGASEIRDIALRGVEVETVMNALKALVENQAPLGYGAARALYQELADLAPRAGLRQGEMGWWHFDGNGDGEVESE